VPDDVDVDDHLVIDRVAGFESLDAVSVAVVTQAHLRP
jgi:hypothetical protein